jgi:hypothetical protein
MFIQDNNGNQVMMLSWRIMGNDVMAEDHPPISKFEQPSRWYYWL